MAITQIENLTDEQEEVIRTAIRTAESAWWNCNGGNAAHQMYIDDITDLHALLGESYTRTPSGQLIEKKP